MAAIIWNNGEKSLIEAWLQGIYTDTPATAATGASGWGLGMGCRAGGVGSTKADAIATISELDHTGAASGYARAQYDRTSTGTGWPNPTLVSSSYQSTAAQKTFTFTGTPNPQGATLWFVAKTNNALNADDANFGADLAATRNFANGDTEKITPTYRQT